MGVIVDRFHEVARDHDTVLVVGSDFTDVAAPTEFSVNAAVAANLGRPDAARRARRRPGPRGRGHDAPRWPWRRPARATPTSPGWSPTRSTRPGSRPPPTPRGAAGRSAARARALPETPLLRAPTCADLMAAVRRDASCTGTRRSSTASASGLVVAAMTMPHVLDRLIDGGVVIVPGDRDDVVLGVLLAHRSTTFPSLSGIVLNGGFPLRRRSSGSSRASASVLPVIASPTAGR